MAHIEHIEVHPSLSLKVSSLTLQGLASKHAYEQHLDALRQTCAETLDSSILMSLNAKESDRRTDE